MKRNAASRNFTKAQLPHNRREQFYDLLKHRYLEFLKLGLILLLFMIPVIVSIVYKDVSLLLITESGETDEDIISSMTFSTNVIYYAMMFVSLLILSVGLSGIVKIIKELIYSEPVFFKEDFRQGIKENVRPFVTDALFVGIFMAIAGVIELIFTSKIIQVIPAAVNYGIIYPVCFLSLFLCSVYKNRLFVNIKTSFALYIRYFPAVVLSYFLCVLIVFLKLIPLSLFYLRYVLIILMAVFYYPTVIFGSYIYQISVYDRNFNKGQFPEFYRRGLFNEEAVKNDRKA